MFTIYTITNLANGKMYIGQTTRALSTRMSEHVSKALTQDDNYKISNAIRKYGPEQFRIAMIEECESFEALQEAEVSWIEYFETCEHGYNIESGGKAKQVSESTRQKMRVIMNANRAAGKYPEKHSEETKAKMRAIPKTEEWKKKIAKANTGKTFSEETRKKMSDAAKRRCLARTERDEFGRFINEEKVA